MNTFSAYFLHIKPKKHLHLISIMPTTPFMLEDFQSFVFTYYGQIMVCLTRKSIPIKLWDKNKPQAQIGVAVSRSAAGATRHPAVPRIAVPATATIHAGRACSRTSRVGLCGGIISAVPISTPFTNVSAHIVDP